MNISRAKEKMAEINQRWGKEQTDVLNQLLAKRKIVPGSTTATNILQSNDPDVLAANVSFKKLKTPVDSLGSQLKKLENTKRIQNLMPAKIG